MVVLGKDAFIFESTGRTCNVEPFSPDLGIAQNIPIVDAAIAYDCEQTNETYILIIRNALHIPSMNHNLLPPFILRQGGIIVNDTAKIHCSDPSPDDHCILFSESELRIPLKLNGIFSYFNSRKPLPSELHGKDKIFITPDSTEWNPNCPSFEINEKAITDHEGFITDMNKRANKPMQLIDDPDEIFDLASVTATAWESAIDSNISECHISESVKDGERLQRYDLDADFSDRLTLRGEISKCSASIGSTIADDKECSVFTKPITTSMDELEHSLSSILEPDQLSAVISTVTANQSKGATPEMLSKLWLIDEDLAKGAIDQNTQLCRHSSDNIMSRQFSTNDRMLRYRRITSTFYTDTMFAQPGAKSTRGNSCCQVFVSDKGFVALYPMRSQTQFQDALHWLCKQVGVPRTLVVDGHKSQTSNKVKRFCDQLGTVLKILETETQWANRAELYIGLLKEAVRKDLKAADCPMVLWDYSIERRAVIHNVIPRPLFQNNGLTPYAAIFRESGDISNICSFGFYEWVYYMDNGSFTANKDKLGRVLGPVKNEGNDINGKRHSSTTPHYA